MRKFFLVVLSIFTSITLFLSCNFNYEILKFEIAIPKVTGTSKFGANVIEWKDVEYANFYKIYRDDIYLGYVQSGKQYYVDFCSTQNEFKEGKIYTYKVEACRNLSRVTVPVFSENDSFASSFGTVEVKIDVGNAPNYGAKVVKPTNPAYKLFTTENDFDSTVVMTQDSAADEFAVVTKGFARLAGTDYALDYIYGGSEVFTIPVPGEYEIYAYNQMRGGDFYMESDVVAAESKVNINRKTDNPRFNTNLNVVSGFYDVTLRWKLAEEALKNNVTFKILKGIVENTYVSSLYSFKDYVKDLKELELVNEKLDISFEEDGSKCFSYCDCDVEKEKKYVYFLQLFINGEYAGVDSETAILCDINEQEIYTECTYLNVSYDDETDEYDSADVYFSYETSDMDLLSVGDSINVERFKFNVKKGWEAPVGIKCKVVEFQNSSLEGNYSKYYITFVDEILPRLNSLEGEYYKYVITFTNEDKVEKVLFTRVGGWDEKYGFSSGVKISVKGNKIKSAVDSITVPFTISTYASGGDEKPSIGDLQLKCLVFWENPDVNKDFIKEYKVFTFKDFEFNEEKSCVFKGLLADTEYFIEYLVTGKNGKIYCHENLDSIRTDVE